jgi:hypothetical protein
MKFGCVRAIGFTATMLAALVGVVVAVVVAVVVVPDFTITHATKRTNNINHQRHQQ